ncbi:hypothetical protein BDF20DRAFT_867549 [Mycotypha africana]|uniref:uncharacterized protein n=1 Tax=Mycotypha africana TaxID=64632 RepID=UPI0023018204|nr:uncharacterized protein BDF20DRAFT_867549 [Mycotypha africana]KAI8979084.1 hypothetical protein BDF20DRAFT_867549 [Mycotypha africana]
MSSFSSYHYQQQSPYYSHPPESQPYPSYRRHRQPNYISSNSSVTSTSSSSSSSSSSSCDSNSHRLGQLRAQLELARNFYDDYEFCPCPLYDTDASFEHRDRIQQRYSPQSSPNTSPKSFKRVIPIINPDSMTPVNIYTA